VNEERFQAWLNLLQAHAVITTQIENELASACGLSLAEHQVLVRLAGSADRRYRMYDLADLLLISKSGTTRLVDRLEKRGLVARLSCEADGRVVFAALSPAGERIVEEAHSILAAALERSFSRHLSDEDVTALRATLRRLLAGNDAWAEHRCAPSYRRGAPSAARTGTGDPP
jgi:DNA-binding MarR family transcriptional regulator